MQINVIFFSWLEWWHTKIILLLPVLIRTLIWKSKSNQIKLALWKKLFVGSCNWKSRRKLKFKIGLIYWLIYKVTVHFLNLYSALCFVSFILRSVFFFFFLPDYKLVAQSSLDCRVPCSHQEWEWGEGSLGEICLSQTSNKNAEIHSTGSNLSYVFNS